MTPPHLPVRARERYEFLLAPPLQRPTVVKGPAESQLLEIRVEEIWVRGVGWMWGSEGGGCERRPPYTSSSTILGESPPAEPWLTADMAHKLNPPA